MAHSETSTRTRAQTRRERERDIVAATRALFDERGMQDAPVEEIARAVGINKALIYRHFASKEELYIHTMSTYLDDLAARLAEVDSLADSVTRLEDGWRRYANFCLEFPAFLDCSLSLMRRPADELRDSVSDAVWFSVGRRMGECLGLLSAILAVGAREGVFRVTDPDFTANHLYAQTLGTMHLARIGIGVREMTLGVPAVFPIAPQDIVEACVADVLASVGATRPA